MSENSEFAGGKGSPCDHFFNHFLNIAHGTPEYILWIPVFPSHQIHLAMSEIQTHNFSGDRILLWTLPTLILLHLLHCTFVFPTASICYNIFWFFISCQYIGMMTSYFSMWYILQLYSVIFPSSDLYNATLYSLFSFWITIIFWCIG